jgi:ribosomal protein L37AE/L43A
MEARVSSDTTLQPGPMAGKRPADYKCLWCGSPLVEAPEAGWWTCIHPTCFSPRLATSDVRTIRATRERELAEAVRPGIRLAEDVCTLAAKRAKMERGITGTMIQCDLCGKTGMGSIEHEADCVVTRARALLATNPRGEGKE